MFLVVGHQVCTHLRRDFVPLLFADPLQVIKVSRLTFGRFSMGWRSGDWLGHSRTLMRFFLSHSFVVLAVCLGSLSCWNTHPRPIFNALAGFNALALALYMAPSIVPFMRCNCPVPLAEKHPQSIMFPPPCLTVGIGSIPPPPNTASWVDAKELDFGLIWPQHFHPVLLWIIGKLQTGCTCTFLSRGTLRALQDFSPSRRSVLPIVFLVTMVPAALRSLTRSSRVVLGWFLTVLKIIETLRGEILHGAPVRGRLTVILCFFHLWIITPTVVTF